MLLIWLFLPVALIIPISLGLPVLAERYLIWVMPAFLIVAALGVVSLSQASRLAGATLLAAILALNLTAVAAQTTQPIKADYRSAMRYVNANSQPGDVMLYQIPYARYAMTYYDARQRAGSPPDCLPVGELWLAGDLWARRLCPAASRRWTLYQRRRERRGRLRRTRRRVGRQRRRLADIIRRAPVGSTRPDPGLARRARSRNASRRLYENIGYAI